MPTFNYTARDALGKTITGTQTAGSELEVSKALRAEGKFPISVQPVAPSKSQSSGIKVPRVEIIQLSTQISIMLETGVTIIDALDCIAQQAQRPKLKRMLDDVSKCVKGGMDLSAALARHPRSFPTLYIALVKASERSGTMPRMIQRATTYLRDEAEIVRKVKGALTYPGIMFAFALLTTIGLLVFVLPRFTALYASKKAALPLPTKILMNVSDALIHNWVLILLSVILGVGGAIAGVKFTEVGRKLFHTFQIGVPMFGAMLRQVYLSRGLRMIGTMAGSGVNLVECVVTARDLSRNGHFQSLWSEVEQQLHHGKQLSEPLFESRLVPRSVAQMIQSAEKSGKLAGVLEQIATFSEEELKEKIIEMTRYIEPAMIIGMGMLIGGVAMALLLPIFTISKVMTH